MVDLQPTFHCRHLPLARAVAAHAANSSSVAAFSPTHNKAGFQLQKQDCYNCIHFARLRPPAPSNWREMTARDQTTCRVCCICKSIAAWPCTTAGPASSFLPPNLRSSDPGCSACPVLALLLKMPRTSTAAALAEATHECP